MQNSQKFQIRNYTYFAIQNKPKPLFKMGCLSLFRKRFVIYH